MTIPDHITRAQLTEAFKALGLDDGEVLALEWEPTKAWLDVVLRPQPGQPVSVDYIAAKIPILERAPQPADDLLGQIGQEAAA